MRRFLLLSLMLAACSTPPPPGPVTQPTEVPGAEKAMGTVKVTATTLNVRREAAATSDVIGQVRKGERLSLLTAGDEWDRVRLGNGVVGFVASQHVIREGTTRARRGCPADADYHFVKTPTPSFSDSSAHGIVTVEANVDARGNVTSTRLLTNTTGDESLGFLAEREIRQAKFSPPVRDCVAKAFIFTYKRSF
ncbi:MAG TPA: SH3 domain-containing protein [Thermoanaerobaculia bacterium]